MKRLLLYSLVFLLIFSSFPNLSFADDALISKIFEQSKQSVGIVEAERVSNYSRSFTGGFIETFFHDFFEYKNEYNRSWTNERMGAGIIIDGTHILTNAHVVRGADRVIFTGKDRSRLSAEIIGQSSDEDMALLEVKEPLSGVPFVFADVESMKVGDGVIAIGNPHGFTFSASKGIISGIGRDVKLRNGRLMQNVIQTDVAISGGNSGGALINMKGELVGMPSFGGGANLNFAISAETIKEHLPVLRQGGSDVALFHHFVDKFGFSCEESKDANQHSVLAVTDVIKETPAFRAGIRSGDILKRVDRIWMDSAERLYAYTDAKIPFGKKVYFLLERDGKSFFTYLKAGQVL